MLPTITENSTIDEILQQLDAQIEQFNETRESGKAIAASLVEMFLKLDDNQLTTDAYLFGYDADDEVIQVYDRDRAEIVLSAAALNGDPVEFGLMSFQMSADETEFLDEYIGKIIARLDSVS